MKASLMVSILVFIISLASFGSGAIPIVCGIASGAWILFVLWRCDRAECIDEEQFEQMALAEKRKKAMCRGTQCLKKSDAN